MRVLIVDDDPDDSQLLAEILNETLHDVSIHYATTCAESRHQLEQMPQSPDLIFLDGKLPGTSSRECYEQMKAQASLTTTRIIIYTDFHKHELERIFGEVEYYLHKTSSLGELRAAIVELTRYS